MKKANELTDKQIRFCNEYLIDLNGTQAAIRAGYSEKSAREIASRMLTNVDVEEYIQQLKSKLDKQLEDKYLLSKERVLGVAARILFADIRDLYDNDGLLKNIKSLTEDEAVSIASIESVEQYEFIDGEKTPVGLLKKIKTYDKIRAITEISKIMGYNADEKKDIRISVDLNEKDIELFSKHFDEKY